MISPRMAMSGRKYSKKPVPVMMVDGPNTRLGSSSGGIVSKFSQTVSGRGARKSQPSYAYHIVKF